jgi:hypothetical protein
MKSGNAAILRHRQEDRALRLFKGVRGVVEYLGEFETDEERPFYTMDAPEANDGPVRSVIVFGLRPLVKTATRATADEVVASSNKVSLVTVEEQNTERTLVERAGSRMKRNGARANSARLFVSTSGPRDMRCSDFEAKGTVERGSVRMALGQLLDYKRFVSGARCALLVPSKPRSDILELVRSAGMELYWPENVGFNAPF